MLLGLKKLKEKRIVHRDIKLGNIFIDDNCEAYIGDFGKVFLFKKKKL